MSWVLDHQGLWHELVGEDRALRLAAALGCKVGDLFPWPDRVPPLGRRAARRERVGS